MKLTCTIIYRYGPVRTYDVIYDDDGDEVTEIEESFVFGYEDYLLTLSGKEWVGVVNVLEEGCEDSWGEIVGWYNANIGELVLVALLNCALLFGITLCS